MASVDIFFSTWVLANSRGWTLEPTKEEDTFVAVHPDIKVNNTLWRVDLRGLTILLPYNFKELVVTANFIGVEVTNKLFKYWPKAYQYEWQLRSLDTNAHTYSIVPPPDCSASGWCAKWEPNDIGGVTIFTPDWFTRVIKEEKKKRQPSVYVVHTWTDYRKENEGDILGVYTNEATAKRELFVFAEDNKSKNSTLEKGDDWVNVINGNNYTVFALKKMPVTDE